MATRKKGQKDAGAAATLLAIIAGLILLYILFLPPQVREELLNGPNATNTTNADANSNDTLLLEHPGIVDFSKENEFIHNIPSVNLYSESGSRVIKKVAAAKVRRNWFSNLGFETSFEVKDLKDLQSAMLVFGSMEGRGDLQITVNGQTLFSGVPQSIKPIELEKGLLREQNTLSVAVNAPGWQFWRTNSYAINDLQILGQVLDTSRQTSTNTFIISSTEKNRLDSVQLKFYPDCDTGEVGKLSVTLNGVHEVYDAVPDCGVSNPAVQVLPQYLVSGENTITFSAERGRYLMDQINIKSKLKEGINPTYFFTISDDQYKRILQNGTQINMTLTFVDDIDNKEATLIINGAETGLAQTDRIYSRRLRDFVKSGNNAIEIRPKTRLAIQELKVFLW